MRGKKIKLKSSVRFQVPIKSTTTRQGEGKKEENSTELQKPNVEAEVYNNNKNVREKKLKSLIRFHSANKIDNYNRGGGGEKEKRNKIQKNLQNKSKHKNNKCFS